MQRIAAALIVLVGCVAALRAVGAPSAGALVEITADALEYESRRGVYVARGSVHLRRGEATLRADWMAFSERTSRGIASGNVVFVDGPDTLYSDFVEFDLASLEGVIFDGRYTSEDTGFRLRAEEIAKTGDDTYTFEDAEFTSCNCPEGGRDPWHVEADSGQLEIEGYGTARNATFEILGVPVLWVPWALYPVKTERQTGLLFPDLSYGGRHGFGLGLPFFWAPRDDVGYTITPRWYSKRGFKVDNELEVLLGEQSGGDLFVSYLHDEEIDSHSVSEPFGRDRWAVRGRQDLFLPLGVRAKGDLRFVSDNQYPTDFQGDIGRARAFRFLESTLFATRHFGAAGAYGAVGSALYADDLQNPDDGDRDDFLLQRWPDVELAALPRPLVEPPRWAPRIVPTLGVQYTRFDPIHGAKGELPTAIVVGDDVFLDTGIDGLPDAEERGPGGGPKGGVVPGADPDGDNFAAVGGPEGDGVFQEGEPLADSGHRVLLTPRLGMPWRVADTVELYPEVGWHQTLYDTGAQGGEERGLFTARVDARTRLQRRFGAGIRHVIEPRIGYAFITDGDDSDDPLFVPGTAVPQRRVRQLQLDNVTLDSADRIERSNGLTWGIGNRIYRSSGERGTPQLLADFELSAGYEFEDGGAFAPLYLDGRAYPLSNSRLRFSVGFDPERGRLEEVLASAAWGHPRGHRFGVSYRYLRQVPRFYEDFQFQRERFRHFDGAFSRVNQLAVSLRIALTETWAVNYLAAYTFERSLLLANRGGVEYISRCKCWAVGIEVSQDRVRGVQASLSWSLLGLGRDDRGRPLPVGGRFGDLTGLGFLDGT